MIRLTEKAGIVAARIALPATILFIVMYTISACNNTRNNQTGNRVTGTAKETEIASAGLSWNIERRSDGEYLTDLEGNIVPLQRYSRMVLLSLGAVETLYTIGGESAIAAIASSGDPVWPEERTAFIPTVGNVARPNLEEIIAINPDIVIGNSMNSAFIKLLVSRGKNAIIHGNNSMDDIFNSAIILGLLSGREAEAEIMVIEWKERLLELEWDLRENPLNLKGAIIYSVNPIMAFTKASLPGNILDLLGVENMAPPLSSGQSVLSPEYILAQNPDFLLGAITVTSIEDFLAADSVFLRTRAGKERNILIIPSTFFMRPSPRIIDRVIEFHEALQGFKIPRY
ncbi:MAG: ABC transporter substrate-binding protein [Spirochaetaceae bacterium]|jgi:iron complex transport system substrate-binding protein|nr:ABC transporter substrate-binding protein [Spirochaetaceae bacterium]